MTSDRVSYEIDVARCKAMLALSLRASKANINPALSPLGLLRGRSVHLTVRRDVIPFNHLHLVQPHSHVHSKSLVAIACGSP